MFLMRELILLGCSAWLEKGRKMARVFLGIPCIIFDGRRAVNVLAVNVLAFTHSKRHSLTLKVERRYERKRAAIRQHSRPAKKHTFTPTNRSYHHQL